MSTHIEQLTEWWENAEKGLANAGDTIIIRHNPEYYEIATATDDQSGEEMGDNTRILTRTPKPKPAWHDAIAVIAHTDDDEDRRAFLNVGNESWCDRYYEHYDNDDLREVAPLIETRVTDEMVKRGARLSTKGGVMYLYPHEIREVLTAALGLNTEEDS